LTATPRGFTFIGVRRIANLRWTAPLLAACLLSGCAVLTKQELKPVPKTLSHGRFVYLANRACARDLRATKNFPRPTSHAMYDRELTKATKSGEHLLFVLRGLNPPASEAKAFRRMLAALNLEDLLAHHVLEAGDLGQRERVKTIFKRGRITDRRFRSRAARLGLDICAKD
jgi:hypothetical protein